MLDKFFKKKNGELNLITISVVVVTLLMIVTLFAVFLFVGESESSTVNNNKDNLSIDTGIPAQHQNVRLEKDKEVTYVTQNEVDKIVQRAITAEMEKIHLEIDKTKKENVDIINQFQKDMEKEINNELAEIRKNNDNSDFDLSKIKSELNSELQNENSQLKERIEKLEKRIDELENDIADKSNNSKEESVERKVELPGNNYSSNPEPAKEPVSEPEVKTETKIVYRDRVIEKEPEPEPEPQKTFIPFRVDGIFAGQNNIAVLSENGSTTNVRAGDNYKQFSIKKVNSNSILVKVDNREIQVNLNDGGREF